MIRGSSDFSLGVSLAPPQIHLLRNLLLSWFEENGRHNIPWKVKADSRRLNPGEAICPYGVWIAEVMLQQTQLNVVLPFWVRWMEKFPTLNQLADSSLQDVLLLWQGLGYYSRARRIHESSQRLMQFIDSDDSSDPELWPKGIDIWMSLPGIGRTTAGSIISTAFDIPKPVLDGNVKRVLARLIGISKEDKHSLAKLWHFSEELLDLNCPRDFNQALMDIGALICTPTSPNCCICPWRDYCFAYSIKKPTSYPVKDRTKALSVQTIGIGIVFNREGEILIDQRLDKGLLGGMWEFPGGKQELDECIKKTIERELKEELAIDVQAGEHLISFEHSYSHKKLSFIVHICQFLGGDPQPLASQKCLWVKPSNLHQYPFPAANAKMIKALNKYLDKEKKILVN